jgi:hypothetical protein
MLLLKDAEVLREEMAKRDAKVKEQRTTECVRRCISRIVRWGLAKAWASWRGLTYSAKHMLLLKDAEVLREEMAKRDAKVKEQRTTECVRRCISRIVRWGLAKAWASWRGLIYSAKRAAQLVKMSMLRMQQSKLFAAWNMWQMYIATWVRAGKVMQMCIARISKLQLAMGWDKWKDLGGILYREAQLEKQQKQAARTVTRAVKNMQGGNVAAAWRKWATLVDRDKHVHRIVQRCVSRIKNVDKARALSKWRELREVQFRLAQQAKAERQAVRTVTWALKGWVNKKLAEAWRVWSAGHAKARSRAQAAAEHEKRMAGVSKRADERQWVGCVVVSSS